MAEEKKIDLAHFLMELALDAEKHSTFRRDPERAMDNAGLAEEQKQLVRTASPYLAYLPVTQRGISGLVDDKPKTIVVVIVVVVVVAP